MIFYRNSNDFIILNNLFKTFPTKPLEREVKNRFIDQIKSERKKYIHSNGLTKYMWKLDTRRTILYSKEEKFLYFNSQIHETGIALVRDKDLIHSTHTHTTKGPVFPAFFQSTALFSSSDFSLIFTKIMKSEKTERISRREEKKYFNEKYFAFV